MIATCAQQTRCVAERHLLQGRHSYSYFSVLSVFTCNPRATDAAKCRSDVTFWSGQCRHLIGNSDVQRVSKILNLLSIISMVCPLAGKGKGNMWIARTHGHNVRFEYSEIIFWWDSKCPRSNYWICGFVLQYVFVSPFVQNSTVLHPFHHMSWFTITTKLHWTTDAYDPSCAGCYFCWQGSCEKY